MTVKRALALVATLVLLPLGLTSAVAASVPGDSIKAPIPIPAKAIPHSFAVNTEGATASQDDPGSECDFAVVASQWFSYTPRDDTVLRLEQAPPRGYMRAYAVSSNGDLSETGPDLCHGDKLLHAGQKYLIVVATVSDGPLPHTGFRATLTFNRLPPSPITKLRIISASVVEPMNVVVVTGVATCNTTMSISAIGKLTQVVSGKVQATADAEFFVSCDTRTGPGVVPWTVALAPAGEEGTDGVFAPVVGTFRAGQPTTWTGDVSASDPYKGNSTHLERVPIHLRRVVAP